ncbi:MAG: DUF362 domain-containing protein [Desulfobacteraceae bacterium]|nr:MAG: DUF362 domain-containing protein [Desulfobacteraceae bacterium]
MSYIALIHCDNYNPDRVEKAVRLLVDALGGIDAFVKPGQKVLLKPNLLGAYDREQRVTTDPAVVRAVAKLVLEAGGIPFIGDSPALHSFKKSAQQAGLAGVAEELKIELVELSTPRIAPVPADSVFKKIEIAAQALDADVIINLPKLKTHSQMLLTLGVKNLFGTVVGQRKGEWHYMAGVDRDTFVDLHLDIYQTVKPSLTILDGVWAMEGNGPSNGRPRHLGLIAASRDAVSLDVCICHVLGASLHSFPLYRAARKRGIGETDLQKMEFPLERPESFAVKAFEIPVRDSLGVLPEWLGWVTKRFLVSKPIHAAGFCTECGQCEKICPAAAIRVKDKKARFDYKACIRCYCCQEVCPQDAIRFKQGFLVKILKYFGK